MNEKDILDLIEEDEWMMSVIRAAALLNLPDWTIGAGFVRNKVWDHLHGYKKLGVDTNDIDLAYFDHNGNDEEADKTLSKKLKEYTGINWEVANQAYTHAWNDLSPYASTEDAISRWPETATALGVTLKGKKLKLIAPYGIDDLIKMIVRPSPKFVGGPERIRERAEQKKWVEKWPKIMVSL